MCCFADFFARLFNLFTKSSPQISTCSRIDFCYGWLIEPHRNLWYGVLCIYSYNLVWYFIENILKAARLVYSENNYLTPSKSDISLFFANIKTERSGEQNGEVRSLSSEIPPGPWRLWYRFHYFHFLFKLFQSTLDSSPKDS